MPLIGLTFFQLNSLMSKPPQSNQDLIADIQANGMQALQTVYEQNRDAFIAFGRKQNAADEDVLDVYQDAVIAFFENVIEGKITALQSSVKTYLFGIGRYMLIHKFKKSLRAVPTDTADLQLEKLAENYLLETENLTHQKGVLATALEQLPGRCQQLLLLFYYRRFSIEAIMHEMNYGSENVVKANKSRCMKQLKKMVDLHDL